MARTKKGRKPFPPKKLFHAKKKEFTKNFDKSKVKCFYCGKRGHFARECNKNKKDEEKFHASTVIEETPKTNAPEEKETREYYLISTLSRYIITREYTWMIDNGASKNMSWFKGVISNLKEK